MSRRHKNAEDYYPTVVRNGSMKYRRPPQLKLRTLASHRCVAVFRKGSGVTT